MMEKRADQETVEQRGLRCQGCGSRKFRVIYTRAVRGGKVMRRRECRNCSKRTTTHERAIG